MVFNNSIYSLISQSLKTSLSLQYMCKKRRQAEAEEYGMYLLNQMGIDSHAKKIPKST